MKTQPQKMVAWMMRGWLGVGRVGGQVGKAAQSRNFLLDPAAPHCSKASQGGGIGNAQNAMQSPKNRIIYNTMQAAAMWCYAMQNIVLHLLVELFTRELHTTGRILNRGSL